MMARLGDICNILNGYAFKSEDYISSGIRIIRIANVQKGYIEDSTPAFYPIDTPNIGKYMLLENDLLVSLTGNVGRVALLKKDFLPAALNQRVACIRIKDDVPYDKSFVYCYLNSDFFENKCIQSAKGVAQKNMSTEWLKEYEIPDLSLEKQREIATVLNKLSDLINFRQQQIIKLDELVKARFVELFEGCNYPICRLRDVCAKITDGTHKTPNYLKSGVTFISAKNIVNGELDFTDVKYISDDEYAEIQKRCQTEMGDILLSKSGSLGAPVIVKTTERIGLFESLAVLKYDRSRLLPAFLCEQLKSDNVQRQFRVGTKGVAIKHLHLGVIADTNIVVPPIDVQNIFAAFVEQTDKSKFEVQQSLEKLETLKKSLMQQYFI